MEHSLSLESFDRNSGGVESALKTDTVTVIVQFPGVPEHPERLQLEAQGTLAHRELGRVGPGQSTGRCSCAVPYSLSTTKSVISV